MYRVGVFVHPWHAYGRSILQGVADYVRLHRGWACTAPWPGERDWCRVRPHGLDAAIVRIGGRMDPPDDFLDDLPRILIANTDAKTDRCDVVWDHEAIGAMAGQHLLDQGHRSVACLYHARYRYQRRRAEAAEQVVVAAGARAACVSVEIDRFEQAIDALRGPTAVFATTDRIGQSVLEAALTLGRRVPEDLAVVGAGDDECYCELAYPPLSSVALPGEEAGYAAAQRLDRLLRGEALGNALVLRPRHVTVRQSSDLLAIDDPLVCRAMRLIRDDHTRPEFHAAHVHEFIPLSRRALEVRFKKAVGRPIDQEICRLRISRARVLLVETDLSIEQVATRSGFSSAQRLSTVFSRETHMPPSAYRRQTRDRRPSITPPRG